MLESETTTTQPQVSSSQQQNNSNSVVDEGGSVPLTLQMNINEAMAEEASQSFMSPQSQDLSQYTSSAFGGQATEGRRAADDTVMVESSIEAGQSNTNRGDNNRRGQDQMNRKQQQKLLPGAPLLEGTASQKQFIIKKQKSKRGSSKGATLMKAYFPNLIAKKDVAYATPTNAQ